ncbi:hypothetical protein G6F23_014760 [Rhizopus arrhizus]|nr:hypothetical protein G6F23_014760 [Rhizopus arrhizus]
MELAADLVHGRLRAAVVVEAMRQGSAGQHGDAAVAGLDGLAQRRAESTAFVQRMPCAPGSHRHYVEAAVAIHVPHRHQCAVFQLQAVDLVRTRAHARLIGAFGDAPPQFGIAARPLKRPLAFT